MAIEIRVESSWETDDGEGRKVEVLVSERQNPWDDPREDSRWFAGGDLIPLKDYLSRVIDERAESFLGRDTRECLRCHRVFRTEIRDPDFFCRGCLPG
jgi:hypothetical protein